MSRKLLSCSRYHPVPFVAVAFAASVGLFCSHARQPTTDINIDTGVWTELRALSEDFVQAAADGDTATLRDMMSNEDVERSILTRVGERWPLFKAAADSVVSWHAAYLSGEGRDTISVTMVLPIRTNLWYCYPGDETDYLSLLFSRVGNQWKVFNYGLNLC